MTKISAEELDLIKISKYAGERFDLVQAGGGNASVKSDQYIFIKASGVSLSEVEENKGYVKLDNKSILDFFDSNQVDKIESKKARELFSKNIIEKANLEKNKKPSIETFLHSLLLKYTLHTHPIIVNAIVIQKNYQELLNQIFKGFDILILEYQTPGIELALLLNSEIKTYLEKNNNILPKIIFLQNHGLIITSDTYDELILLNELVIKKIETFLSLDLNRYKITNKISNLINEEEDSNKIAFLSEDLTINSFLVSNKHLFFLPPFCPDKLVYCGISAVELKNLEDFESIKSYKKQYLEIPKVIIYNNHCYFTADSIKKAREIEEIFKFHLLSLSFAKDDFNFLSSDELDYLNNWDSEKYRQKI